MTSFKMIMENSERLINRLAENSGLEKWMVENILQYANQMPKQKGGDVDLLIFMAQMSKQFDLNSVILIQSMYETLKKAKTQSMTVEEYARAICLFLSDDLDSKVEFVFRVYDVNHDGMVEWHELYTLLRPCIISPEPVEDADTEDSLRELVDMVLKVTDMDMDGFISCEEFKALVKSNILYLQVLGPCLPSEIAVQSFKNKLTGKTPFQVSVQFSDERIQSLSEIKINMKKTDQLYPIRLELP
ncbi:calcineurin subunit B [Biomphalaria pfeifferi]|uniref:Calcineurin subunit B n=1 Tax=Biomphalaria pfeifferi TaxID=112525 RepID=A0AAD8FAV2_BIOPF|nr:calcineurin subunit B [Biomphalaria pfeifferi]